MAEATGLAFEKQYFDVRIDVHGGNSSVGITAPQTRLADVGMVSRPLRHNETPHLTSTIFALIAHTSNPVNDFSTQQIVDLHTGAVANWYRLRGNDTQIVVVNKKEGRGTRNLFEQDFGLAGQFVSSALIRGVRIFLTVSPSLVEKRIARPFSANNSILMEKDRRPSDLIYYWLGQFRTG